MHHHRHSAVIGEPFVRLVDVFRAEELVHRAVALPTAARWCGEWSRRRARRTRASDSTPRCRSSRRPRSASTSVRKAERRRGVATEMLIGKEEDLDRLVLAPRDRCRPRAPIRRPVSGIRARAARTAALPDHRLHRGGRIDVRDRNHAPVPVGAEGGVDLLPRGERVVVVRHVRHRAAGGEIRQDHRDVGIGHDVGGLRHEVDTGEHDVLRAAASALRPPPSARAADCRRADRRDAPRCPAGSDVRG